MTAPTVDVEECLDYLDEQGTIAANRCSFLIRQQAEQNRESEGLLRVAVATVSEQAAQIANEKKWSQQVGADNTNMIEQIAELRKDAERYRWLRDQSNAARHHTPTVNAQGNVSDLIDGPELDAAIDAAIASQGEKG